MKKNKKLLKRLDHIESELKKAERQIKRQFKDTVITYKIASEYVRRAKTSVRSLYYNYDFCVRFKDENENEFERR